MDAYQRKPKTQQNRIKENSEPVKKELGNSTKRTLNEKSKENCTVKVVKSTTGAKNNQSKRISLEEQYQLDLERKKKLAEQALKKSVPETKKPTKLNIASIQQRTELTRRESKEPNKSFRNQNKLTEEGSFCNQSLNGKRFIISNREKLENTSRERKIGKSLEKSFQGKKKLDEKDFVNLNTSRLALQNKDSTMFNSSSIMSNFQSFIGSLTDRPINEQKQRAKSVTKSTNSLNKKMVSNMSKDKLLKITQSSARQTDFSQHKKQSNINNSNLNETKDWSKALSYLRTVIKLDSVSKNWDSLTHRTNETVNEVKIEEKQEENNLPEIKSEAKDYEKEEEIRKVTTYFTCASYDEIPENEKLEEKPEKETEITLAPDTSFEVREEAEEQSKYIF